MQNKEYNYLDLLGKGLDPYQEQACCRTENTIIAAGAGSGKTQVLASRFAWLVMSKNIPAKKILTLTFTNKAAAEMYFRIYKSLSELATNPNTPQKEKERAAIAIEEFSEVHIQTLDSYCKNIVSQAANRYGISPDFSIGSDDSNMSLQALQFVLKNRDNPAIKHFLGNSDLQAFAKSYFYNPITQYTSIADNTNLFAQNFQKQASEIQNDWNNRLSKINQIPSDLSSLISEISFDKDDNNFIIINNTINNFPELSKISSLNELENDDSDVVTQIKELNNILSQLFNVKLGSKNIYKELSTYIKSILNDTLLFSIIGFVLEYSYIKELSSLLDDFSAQSNESKRKSSSLSFSDVTKLTIKILSEQKDILIQEQNAYDKIMIDEFQDNNKLNRDLLFLLSQNEDTELDSEKLFFVGDEKQSIYKFRGADVSVFNELKNDLNTTPLQMIYNYRSNNSLLASFNKLFSNQNEDGSQTINQAVFDATSEYSFEATFPKEAHAKKSILDEKGKRKELETCQHTKENINAHICMLNTKLLESDDEEFLSSDNQQAYFIAKKIKEIYLATPESERKYSHFAYLDKSRRKRRFLKNWLNHFGIPYNLDSQGDLFSEAPVNDIYSFFKLCVYPSDTLAFATYLRSPFSRLSQQSVNTILAIIKKESKNIPQNNSSCFDEKFTTHIEKELSPKEYENYKKTKDFFEENKTLVLSQKITKSLTTLWYKTGYYYETLQNTKVNLLAEQYDLLFEIARQCDSNGKNIGNFVDALSQLKNKESDLYGSDNDDIEFDMKDISYPIEKPDAVQIMTIHKSKGLQFKHVFINGCMNKPQSASKSKFYESEEYGLVISPLSAGNYFFEKNRDLENAKNEAEFKRVIYVAVTRAEDDFYLIGDWAKTSKDDIEKQSLMQQIVRSYYPDAIDPNEKLAGVVQYADNAPFDFTSIKPVTVKEAYSKNTKQKENDDFYNQVFDFYQNSNTVKTDILISNRKTPSSFEKEFFENNPFDQVNQSENAVEPTFDSSSSVNLTSDSEDTISSDSFQATDFGTLAHLFLETQANGIQIETFIPNLKLFKNLSENEKAAIIDQCRNYCKLFKESSLGKQFENSKKSKRFFKAEYAFRMYYEKNIITGSIDLIFQNENGTYTIVDYKTDKNVLPEIYNKQQELYRIAASKLLKCNPEQIECYLFYLRHNKEVKLF